MARLIVGDGQTRSAQHDANIFAKIFGTGTLIAPGEMKATKPDNNTIRIGRGMAICEGRVFENETYDDFAIQTGDAGQQTTYYLGYRIYQQSSGDKIEKYISSDLTVQGSLSMGDSEMFAILYTATMDGINLGDPVLVCSEIPDIVNNLIVPESEEKTVTLSDKSAPDQKELRFNLSKTNGIITCCASNVFNFMKTSKTVALSGTIPAGYRPKNIVGITCILVNNAKVSGFARFTVDPEGKVKYVSNASGWQEVFLNASWSAKE